MDPPDTTMPVQSFLAGVASALVNVAELPETPDTTSSP